MGHVLRKPKNDITRVALRWNPEIKRRKGRPRTSWRRTVKKDIRTGTLPGECGKDNQEQRRFEIPSRCSMCLRMQQGLCR